jgi:hypothetical protein
MRRTTLGQIAYEAYYDYCDGKSAVTGAPLPPWDKQSVPVRAAWESAADAVREELVLREPEPEGAPLR